MTIGVIKQFLQLESASGVLLLVATILAIICSNTALSGWYIDFLSVNFTISVGSFALSKPILLWINDGLMAIFFLLVGLELKRECLQGQLRGIQQITLPLIAAVAGVAVPALMYCIATRGDVDAQVGWAIPTATDIAFALGILSLFGSKIPLTLRLFLMALAIIDDIAAIMIIAIFHTSDLSVNALMMAGFLMALLFVVNRFGVRNLIVYVFLGILLWISVLKSGVHATLAGVVVGLAVPLKTGEGREASPLVRLEKDLHPWVAFLIMPLFAFANAGLSFAGMSWDILLSPVVRGIIGGLFVGKQIGILGAVWIVVKLGIARLPSGSSWLEVYGVALLCGVGFTMSLFIGSLAFEDLIHYHVQVRLGVLVGSMLSGIIGFIVLKVAVGRKSGDLHER